MIVAPLRPAEPIPWSLAVPCLSGAWGRCHRGMGPGVPRCLAFECSSLSQSLVLHEGILWSIVVKVIIILVEVGQLLKVDLVAQDAAHTTEALDELVALG